MWITTNCEKSLKGYENQTTLPASWEICMQVKKQQFKLDVEQQTGSKLGMAYIKAVYCHLAFLTYMQSTSCEMPNWMKHKLESWMQGEISVTSDMQMTPPFWGSPGSSDRKASAYNTRDPGLIPGSGRSPGEGNSNPLQYSCLEIPMDRGAWWAKIHGLSKSQTRLSDFTSLPPLWQTSEEEL